MPVSSLGYLVIESNDLDAWRKFAVDAIGLMEARATADGSLRFRLDERPFRLLIHAGKANRLIATGWEFPNDATFLACRDSLRRDGVEVVDCNAADAESRAVRSLCRCVDPSGNSIELFTGRAQDHVPFVSPKGVSGFVTGDMGLGHVVLPAPQLEKTRRFYEQHFGFALTDEMWLQMSPQPTDPKLGIYFMHAANPRHHSLALMGAPAPSGCVHFMLQARTIDDVGYALDRCMASGVHITSTLGRHSNDFMLSFYALTPGGFDLELGCDGLRPDWSTWVPTVSLVPDLWGHRWTPPPAAS